MLREWVVRGGGLGASGNRDCQWASKNSYSNSIRVGYYRMDQIREGVSGDGLGGNFWEEGLPPCIHSQLEFLISIENISTLFANDCDI